MATASPLLGPPSLRHAPPPSAAQGGAPPTTTPSENPSPEDSLRTMITNQIENVNLDSSNQKPPPMGLTENLSPTFLSTGNPCLDFFFQVVPDTRPEDLTRFLELSWESNPLTTLKLICNLRGVRGTGKSDKEGFYTAALWLHHHHPKTLSGNVKAIAEFGYFKDFLEILFRILEGPFVRKIAKDERKRKFVRLNEDMKQEKEMARILRKEKEINKAKKALEKYSSDENYRVLYDSIASFFAELLRDDLDNLNSGNLNKISLAAKWCPTIDSSYDRATLICESIARKMFPRDKYSEFEGIEERHYVYRVRDRLRKEVLVQLHKALKLPEVYMSANKWNSLPYNRVPSVAMKNYKKLFLEHDRERFNEYLENVKSGKAKIAAGALLPHEIIKELTDEEGREVAELQWKRMVDDMAEKGKLSNCIAVCDVSGSMGGIPMEVCVALGLLVSELSKEPWRGKVITFSDEPQIHMVEGETLLAKTEFVRNMDWGGSTNFQSVFDRILEVAVEGKLKEEQLVKRVIVFSDMEFNEASRNPWETDYQAISRKFRENGYKSVPEIVFWNLRSSRSIPVVGKQSGVALVSGFSKNLLTMFMEGGGIVTPVQVMELAVAGEEYQKLAVFD